MVHVQFGPDQLDFNPQMLARVSRNARNGTLLTTTRQPE